MDTLYWHRVSGARADGQGGAGKRGEERGNLKKIEVAEGNLFSLTFFKQRMTSSSANSIFFKHKRIDKFECEIWRERQGPEVNGHGHVEFVEKYACIVFT